MKWTSQQKDAVQSTGTSLVVSAAAGSGKTAVLAARFVRLVVEERLGVEEILVATFTNAAARQMRDRIAARLAEAAVAATEPAEQQRLTEQLAALPRASIGTLSSFCSTLVRRHFDRANVDPAFGVLDEDHARTLRRQAARDVVEAALAKDDEAAVQLIDDVFDGRDRTLADTLVEARAVSMSTPDPGAWLTRSLEVADAVAADPIGGGIGEALLAVVRSKIGDLPQLADKADAAAARAAGEKKLAKLAGFTSQLAEAARQLDENLAAGRLVLPTLPARMPSVANDVPGKAELKAAADAVRDALKEPILAELAAFDHPDARAACREAATLTHAFVGLCRAFAATYAESKTRLRVLDFADLEHAALALLRNDQEPSAVATEQQARFAHVLVDESQDINAVQDELLRLVSRESSSQPNNLFCVGDVKQSVYRFRLAEPRMFLRRLAAEGAGRRRIDLAGNFRSRPPLLAAINHTFGRLMTEPAAVDIDYRDRHALLPNPAYPPVPERGFDGGPIALHVLDPAAEVEEDADEGDSLERIEREAVFVAEQVRRWIDDGRQVLGENGEVEPLGYRHVAVLMRSQKYNSRQFASALRRQGVPCHAEVGTGFFDALEVRDAMSVLRSIDNRRQDVPLASYLRSPAARLPGDAADHLGRIRLQSPDVDSFHEAAVAFAAEDDALQAALDRLDAWDEIFRTRPLAEAVWHVLSDGGLLAYAGALDDGQQRTANLLSLHARAAEFDATGAGGLGAFLAFLDEVADAGEVGQPPAVAPGEDAVRVMSVHAAKGLEFPVVFLVDCGKRHNTRDATGLVLADRDRGVALPAVCRKRMVRFDSPQQILARTEARRASVAEELRILYVAMTRAREHLVCVGHAPREADALLAKCADVDGPMPGRQVLQGQSFLDWLVAAANGATAFKVQVHPAADYDRLDRLAQDEAVPAAVLLREEMPATDEARVAAAATIARLTTPYPHIAATEAPAEDRLPGPRRRDEAAGEMVDVDALLARATAIYRDVPLYRQEVADAAEGAILRGRCEVLLQFGRDVKPPAAVVDERGDARAAWAAAACVARATQADVGVYAGRGTTVRHLGTARPDPPDLA
jgi:ATP-dependent helicase/nuclease subunit A